MPRSSNSQSTRVTPTPDTKHQTDNTGTVDSSGGQTLLGNLFHHLTETIQLRERCVDIGCDTDTLKLVMNDRRCEDSMLCKQVIANCRRIKCFNLNVGYCARLVGVKRGIEANLR